ncbi:MAG: hypothetical protein AAFZ52_17360 [Bacteroidota bacterium]
MDIDWEAANERFRTLPDRIHHIPGKRLIALLENNGFSTPDRFWQVGFYGGWVAHKYG